MKHALSWRRCLFALFTFGIAGLLCRQTLVSNSLPAPAPFSAPPLPVPTALQTPAPSAFRTLAPAASLACTVQPPPTAPLMMRDKSRIERRNGLSARDQPFFVLHNVQLTQGAVHLYGVPPNELSHLPSSRPPGFSPRHQLHLSSREQQQRPRLPAESLLVRNQRFTSTPSLSVVTHSSDDSSDRAVCERTLSIVRFIVPYFESNLFHLLNDNVLAVAANLLSEMQPAAAVATAADPRTLPCAATGQWLLQFDPIVDRALKRDHPPKPLAWRRVLSHAIFGGRVAPVASMLPPVGAPATLCARVLVWGLGHKPLYYDDLGKRAAAVAAMRSTAIRHFAPSESSVEELGDGTNELRRAEAALEMTWPTSSANESNAAVNARREDALRRLRAARQTRMPAALLMMRRSAGAADNRHLCETQPIVDAFRTRGMKLVECCDGFFNLSTRHSSSGSSEAGDHNDDDALIRDMLHVLSRADIIVGLHGAALANALFARTAPVVAELAGPYGERSELFRKVAQARHGAHFQMRVTPTGSGPNHCHAITTATAEATADCALQLWLGDPHACDSKEARIGLVDPPRAIGHSGDCDITGGAVSRCEWSRKRQDATWASASASERGA